MAIKSGIEWNVTGTLLGKPKRDDPTQFRRAKDVSGIACSTADGFPRPGVVIDDESQFAQTVAVHDGAIVAGPAVRLIDDTFDGEPVELDGEAVAYADGYFYVIGSHGHPRDKRNNLDPVRDAAEIAARIQACSKLLRFSINPAEAEAEETFIEPASIVATTALKDILRSLPDIAGAIDQPLGRNGLTIEGLGVTDQHAYVGLRSPVVRDLAPVVVVSLDALFEGASGQTSISLLDLGGRGIRDLAVDGQDFLILAGPPFNEEVSFAIYRWNGESSPSLLAELPPYPSGGATEPWKPECILPLGRDKDYRRVLILLDSVKDGAPRELLIEE